MIKIRYFRITPKTLGAVRYFAPQLFRIPMHLGGRFDIHETAALRAYNFIGLRQISVLAFGANINSLLRQLRINLSNWERFRSLFFQYRNEAAHRL